jgi:hypothetical protein
MLLELMLLELVPLELRQGQELMLLELMPLDPQIQGYRWAFFFKAIVESDKPPLFTLNIVP